MRTLRSLFALVVVGVVASTAQAQCPDGSPPPCRGGAAAPAPRRAAPLPALDEDTWIVVPFDNLAKADDAEWLRGASVNLLYLDMSRWKDIRVIDDERVSDLLRETPEAANAQALSLGAGIAVAKRAGAGRLVMGDVLKLGTRTRVTAKIFDVKTGQRVRSVQEEATVQDSVMPLFGKLARKILNVAPPAGANVGAIGTTRTDAYQEYFAGVQALNRFDLVEAGTHLRKALTLDSTFALAHYKLSIVLGWSDPGDASQRTHAEAAARFQTGLPQRERTLIVGLGHQAKNEWSRACETYGAMAKADSTDVEALYGLGECLFHDPVVVAVGGDTTKLRLAADWQGSIRAFSRVLELDPQYHLAYQHIVDALMNERQAGRLYCVEGRCRQVIVNNVRVGDSLVPTPVLPNDTAGARRELERYVETRSKPRNLAAARRVAEAWVQSAPNEGRAQTALATVALAQGDAVEAEALLAPLKPTGALVDDLRRTLFLMEARYKAGHTAAAAQTYDSMRADTRVPPGQGNANLRLGNALAGYGAPFGRLSEVDSLMAIGMRMQGAPPAIGPFARRNVRLMIGAPPDDSLVFHEKTVFELTRTSRGARVATRTIGNSLSLALRHPRAVWPELDTTLTDVKLRPAFALMRGDTAALRKAARALDSTVRVVYALAGNDSAYSATAAEAYLALRDTISALRAVRFALDTAVLTATYFPPSTLGYTTAFFAPRLMLLRADLAAAKGFAAEARIWYDRYLGAFDKASPELQPIVERAKKARAALPAGGG